MFAPVDLPCVRHNLRDVITPIIFVEVYSSEASVRFLPPTSQFCPHGCKETHSDRQDISRRFVTSAATILTNNPQAYLNLQQ